MNLNEFRKQNPAYSDTEQWPDQKLADGLYNKFYSDMDRAEFDTMVAPPKVDAREVRQLEEGKPLNFFEGRIAEPRKRLSGGPESIVPDLGAKQSPLPGEPPMSSAPDALSPEEQLRKDMFGATAVELATAGPRRVVGGALKSVNNLATHGQFAFKTLLKKAFPGVDWDYYADIPNEDVYSQELMQDKIARVGSELTAEIPGEEYVDPISFKGALSAGPEALGQTGAAFLGGRQLILPLMWMQTAGGKIQEIEDNDLLDQPSGWITYLKEKGYSDEATLLLGELHGGAEIVGEKTALNLLFKKWGKSWTKDLTKFVAAETGQESITEGLQALTDKWSTEPDMTWGDFKRRYQQMLVTLPVVLGGVTAGAKTAQEVHRAVKQGVTKGQRAGKILEQLIGSQEIDPQVAEDIANLVLQPQQEGAIEPTGHLQGERVGPGAGTKHRQLSPEAAQQDKEDKAKIQKALEEELGQKEIVPKAPVGKEIKTDEEFEQVVKDNEAANKVEREYTGAPTSVMEDAFRKATLGKALGKVGTEEGAPNVLMGKPDERRVSPPQETPEGVEMDPEGNITLHHYSDVADLTELDPAKHGEGIRGAEAKRKAADPAMYPNRLYFYMDTAHKKERNLGKERYAATVPLQEIYPLQQDPDGLADQATTVSKYNPDQKVVNYTKLEKLIKDAGYSGYWSGNPQLGKAAVLFHKTPVTPRLNPEKLTYQLKLKGGYTVDPRTGAPKGEGFSVGIGLEETTPGYAKPEQIQAYQAKHADALAKPDHYAGGWVYEGKTFQDVSQVHTGDAAGLKAAILQGKKNNEIGIQDLSKEDPDEGYIELAKVGNVDQFVADYDFTPTTGKAEKSPETAAPHTVPRQMLQGLEARPDLELGRVAKTDAALPENLELLNDVQKTSSKTPRPMKVLTNAEYAIVGDMVTKLKTLGLPDLALGTVRGYMNLEWDTLGGHQTIHPHYGNKSILGLAKITSANKSPLIRASMLQTLAHEVGHSVDQGSIPRGGEKEMASDTSPMFTLAGSQMGPIMKELDTVYRRNLMGLKKGLAYPMQYIASVEDFITLVNKTGSTAYAHAFLAEEAFAQLFGYYYTYGKTDRGAAQMQEYMPVSFEFMENIDEILRSSKDITERDARIRKTFRTFKPGGYQGGAQRGQPGPESPQGGPAGQAPPVVQGAPQEQAARTATGRTQSVARAPTSTETARAVKRADAIDTVPILEGTEDVAIKGTGPHGRVTGPDIGRAMNRRTRKLGKVVKIGDYRPQTVEHVAQSLYQEISYQLERDDSAIGWYDDNLSRAMDTLSALHPELITDPNAEAAFKLALAVTSNGVRVNKNFEMAESAYRTFKSTGRYPENIGIGVVANQMNGQLKLLNDLIQRDGMTVVREFMNTVHPVRMLRELGFPISGELVNSNVHGSTIFGSKLGNFYQNLNGNYAPVTMDRWFARTINRITGNMLNPKSETGLTDAPRNGSEREWMRSIMGRVQDILQGEGTEVTVADLQALLWYHEKAIFSTLRGRKSAEDKQTQEDYASAAERLYALQRQPAGQDNLPGGGPATQGIDNLERVEEGAEAPPLMVGGVEEHAVLPQHPFQVPPERKIWDVTARKMQDKFQRLYVTQKTIRDQGGTIDITRDPYAAEERMHGKIEWDFKQLEHNHLEPLAEYLADNKIPMTDLDLYLYARHAPERNQAIAAKRADTSNPMPDGGSGMSTATAVQISDALETQYGAPIETAAQMVWDMLAAKRQNMVDMSLIEQDVIDQWEDSYDHYVPLKGFADDALDIDNQRQMNIGRGLSIKGKEFRQAWGRQSMAKGPTAQAIADTTESIIRARKNEVGQYFLNLVYSNPNPGFWEIYDQDNPDMAMQAGEMRPVAMHLDPKYFGVKIGGKQYYVKMNDARLARAMNNLGVEEQGVYVRTMGAVTRFLSSVNTSLNPEFVISNFSRDIQTAVLNVLAETDLHDAKVGGEKIAWKMVKDTKASGSSIYRALRGKPPRPGNEFDQLAYDFLKDGGKTGYFDSKDLAGLERYMNSLVQMSSGGALGTAKKMGKATANFVEDINSTVENAVRLSAYINARKALEARGRPSHVARKKAAHLSKNLTVNFNRRGELSSGLNATWMFFNASAQGSAQFARTMLTLKKTEHGGRRLNMAQKAAAALTVTAYLMAFMNRWLSDEDDDERTFYDKIPPHVKERNLIVMKPEGFKDEPGDYWQVPLPYGYNIFYVLGTTVNDVVHGNREPLDGALDITSALLGSFNPVGMSGDESWGATAIKTAAPTWITPGVEIVANSNFFGGPIYDVDRYNERTPESSLAFRTTKEHWKQISRWMNRVTGGSLYEKGGLDLSPDKLEHWFEFVTGGAGKFVERSANVAWKLKEGVPLKDREIPFYRKVNAQASEYENGRLYYERRPQALAKEDTYRAMLGKSVGKQKLPADYKAAREYKKEFADWFKLVTKSKVIDKQLKRLRKEQNAIQVDEGLTEAERQRELDRIQRDKNVEYNKFNLLWNQLIEKD